MAIPIYTVLPYCVMITQYGSAVNIGMAQHYSVLKEILMILSICSVSDMCSKGTSG